MENEKEDHDAHKSSEGVIPQVLGEMGDHPHGKRQLGHSSTTTTTSSVVVATSFSRVRVGWKHSGGEEGFWSWSTETRNEKKGR